MKAQIQRKYRERILDLYSNLTEEYQDGFKAIYSDGKSFAPIHLIITILPANTLEQAVKWCQDHQKVEA